MVHFGSFLLHVLVFTAVSEQTFGPGSLVHTWPTLGPCFWQTLLFLLSCSTLKRTWEQHKNFRTSARCVVVLTVNIQKTVHLIQISSRFGLWFEEILGHHVLFSTITWTWCFVSCFVHTWSTFGPCFSQFIVHIFMLETKRNLEPDQCGEMWFSVVLNVKVSSKQQ